VIAVDPVFSWIARLGLCALFGAAAVHKARDLRAFTVTLRDYRVLPDRLAPIAAPLVAASELAAAAALLVPSLGSRRDVRARPAHDLQRGDRVEPGTAAEDTSTARPVRGAEQAKCAAPSVISSRAGDIWKTSVPPRSSRISVAPSRKWSNDWQSAQ
jgi:hypothetical protein